MKPEWDTLGEFFNKPDSRAQIVDVDCTAETSSKLCDKYGVQGYPTIKYFSRDTSEMGELYEGDRDYKKLKKFVKANSKEPCDYESLQHCSTKEKAFIDEVKNWDPAKVATERSGFQSDFENAKKKHEHLAELFEKQKEEAMATSKQLEEAQKEMEKITKQLKPKLNILEQMASKLEATKLEENTRHEL